MATILEVVLDWTLRVALGVAVIVYAGLVFMTYATEGPRYRPRFDLDDPFRSLERLLRWLGVKAVDAMFRMFRAAMNICSEASAEVGEWLVARRSQKALAEFRSRVW